MNINPNIKSDNKAFPLAIFKKNNAKNPKAIHTNNFSSYLNSSLVLNI